MTKKTAIKNLTDAIVARQTDTAADTADTPGQDTSQDAARAQIDLLAIPWWLDRRPGNPRLVEANALRAKWAKEVEKNRPAPLPAKALPLPEPSAYQEKRAKKARLDTGVDLILASIERGQTLSGRKLKALFAHAVTNNRRTLKLTDYERCIRFLCKNRGKYQAALRKIGRSYERTW